MTRSVQRSDRKHNVSENVRKRLYITFITKLNGLLYSQ